MGTSFDNVRRIQYPAIVCASFLVRVLFAVLALQWAIGLQADVAYAMPTPDSTNVMQGAAAHTAKPSDDACPMHGAPVMHGTSMPSAPMHITPVRGEAMHGVSATSAPHGKVPHDNFSGKHDCCKSSCQCQCGSVPLAFNLAAARGILASVYLQPVTVTRVAHAPTDTHFRPPIA